MSVCRRRCAETGRDARIAAPAVDRTIARRRATVRNKRQLRCRNVNCVFDASQHAWHCEENLNERIAAHPPALY